MVECMLLRQLKLRPRHTSEVLAPATRQWRRAAETVMPSERLRPLPFRQPAPPADDRGAVKHAVRILSITGRAWLPSSRCVIVGAARHRGTRGADSRKAHIGILAEARMRTSGLAAPVWRNDANIKGFSGREDGSLSPRSVDVASGSVHDTGATIPAATIRGVALGAR